jgi:hypothetical protein
MSCCVANATIDYNAVTIHTKRVDQQGFGGLAKGGSNDIMDRRSSMQLFFTNDHRRRQGRDAECEIRQIRADRRADKIRDSSRVAREVPLAAGEYEINIYPLSEIIPNKRLINLGAVIAELQVPIVIEATVGKNAADPGAAQALIAFLHGPAIDQALTDNGMEKSRISK